MFFFFNDTATTEIYTLSLHDALPISSTSIRPSRTRTAPSLMGGVQTGRSNPAAKILGLFSGIPSDHFGGYGLQKRSEEHTSELQSRQYLVCRLLLEKKKKKITQPHKS